MPSKRKRSQEDSDDSSDEDYSASRSISTSGRSAKKKPKKRSPSPLHGSVAQRMSAAGLGPKSLLFGGDGISTIGKDRYDGGKEKISLKSTEEIEARKVAAKRINTKALGNTLLPFAPAGKRRPQQLDYPEGELLTTTRPKRRGGNKKKNDDDESENSTSESEDSSDEEEEDGAVSLAKVIGAPERAQLAIVGGSAPQTWILNHFGSFPKKPRSSRVKKIAEKDVESEDEDGGGSGKKKGKKPSKPTRTYKDNDPTSLLVIHAASFEEGSTIHRFKKVITHQTKEESKFNANLYSIMYTDSITKRLTLRIFVTTALPTPENWKTTENTIWVQDYPELGQKPKDFNPTHTAFSSAFFNFLAGGVALPTSPEYKCFVGMEKYFDFSASKTVQPVVSYAGVWEGAHELSVAGGFNSLAKAIKSFGPEPGGSWRIEYLTPTSLPITEKFLRRLFAAAQGVTPIELDKQETQASKAARSKFSRDKIKIAYPTVDTVDSAIDANTGRYSLRFETDQDLDFDLVPASDARRHSGADNYTVMHDVKLKSGRVNHSNMLLIYHTPKAKSSTDYEAFLYIGSHSPSTQESWGAYKKRNNDTGVKLVNTEFGVLTKLSAESWRSLIEVMNDAVPYERPLKPYGSDDIPCPTPPPKVPKSPKSGRKTNREKKKGAKSTGSDSE